MHLQWSLRPCFHILPFKVLFNNQYNYYPPVITIDYALNNIDFILKPFLCLLFSLKTAVGVDQTEAQ